MGPTAVGKTAIGIQVAQHFSTEIISADSRQCYKELEIGVAKPSNEELQTVLHHFINSHSIADIVNAAVFESYALEKIGQIFDKNDVAVMVGGTGLYIKTFCEGIDEVPSIKPGIREQINDAFDLNGINWLQQEVQKKDPAYYSRGEIKNPHRLMRALEVVMSTGRSILSFHENQRVKRDFNIIRIGLELPRPELYNRINDRVDKMMDNGLLEEVRSLLPYKHLNALQTVGYRELFGYLEGTQSLPAAVESIKTNTRHYAKRQVTWFKKDNDVIWRPPDYGLVIENLKSSISQ